MNNSSLKMEALNRIKSLKNCAAAVGGFFDKYREVTSQSSCDKHQALFGGDGRFTVFKLSVPFTSYTGYYGNSSCSTFRSLNQELVHPYFVKALNRHARQLFETAAKEMQIDADQLEGEARKEIEALQAMLKELTQGEDGSEAA